MIRLVPERDAANQNFLLLETVEENENAVTKEEGFGTETLSLMEKQGFSQPSDIREEPPSTEFCTFARVMGLPLLFKGINIDIATKELCLPFPWVVHASTYCSS